MKLVILYNYINILIKRVKTGKMVQSVKCLLCKHEDLGSDPITYVRSQP